ncbi:MAG: HU family DNA-binding protein [Halieaceae bacterium]|nr:HU family DNA-binding protein [Halieaceae bacterium]
MNKNELIDVIAAEADLPKAAAGRALDAAIGAITDQLAKGESVAIVGFGTFAVKPRAAREGRNPRTGETIKIAASNTPSFKPGKGLKDAVNA